EGVKARTLPAICLAWPGTRASVPLRARAPRSCPCPAHRPCPWPFLIQKRREPPGRHRRQEEEYVFFRDFLVGVFGALSVPVVSVWPAEGCPGSGLLLLAIRVDTRRRIP